MDKDLIIALSLSNLCFIRIWSSLQPNGASQYYLKYPHAPAEYYAAILNVLALALVFWISMALVRRLSHGFALKLAKWAFLLVLAFSVNGIRNLIPALSLSNFIYSLGLTGMILLFIVPAIALILVLVRWPRLPVSAAKAFVIVLFPLIFFTFSMAIWSLCSDQTTAYADKSPAVPINSGKQSLPRILWFVFDEMDQQTTFPGRPGSVSLPEIDRFSNQAICASNAYPPADSTLKSMPALITGKLVANAQPVSSSELMLTFAGSGETVKWSSQPNIFSKARAIGINAAVVGWYHPYGRTIGSSLVTCSWQGKGAKKSEGETSLFGSVVGQWDTLLNNIPFRYRFFGHKRYRQEHITLYSRIREDALKAAASPEPGLILVHWPLPHLPGIYNRFTGELSMDGDSSYLDNLVLTDHTLGELRRAMETAGTWENTTVLITSDHWWRIRGKADHRVPFMLKLAGQKKPVVHEPAFNTVLTHDLLLALMEGELSDPDSVTGWLNRRSGF